MQKNHKACLFTLGHAMIPPMHEDILCDQFVVQQFRKKYCLARVEKPIDLDAAKITSQTVKGTVPIAVHYRGGDLAVTENCYKRQPFQSVVQLMIKVADILARRKLNATFHFFSEAPYAREIDRLNANQYSGTDFAFAPNLPQITSNNYFDVLFSNSLFTEHKLNVILHIDEPAETSFHALVTASILIASGSGYSTIAQMLRRGPTLAIRPSCSPFLTRVNNHGQFDEADFEERINLYFAQVLDDAWNWWSFDSESTCYESIEQWPDIPSFNSTATYEEQGFTNPCI